ncbi:hypothetical protein KAW43_02930 [Candidatus Parcubacteria bacterium]|nr:hypothetical protein [Candidatus Parcubacteria bacterium]
MKQITVLGARNRENGMLLIKEWNSWASSEKTLDEQMEENAETIVKFLSEMLPVGTLHKVNRLFREKPLPIMPAKSH